MFKKKLECGKNVLQYKEQAGFHVSESRQKEKGSTQIKSNKPEMWTNCERHPFFFKADKHCGRCMRRYWSFI